MLGWIFVAFAAGLVLERARPGWRSPRVRTWAWRVVAVNAVQLAVVVVAGVTWERWAQAASLLDLGATLAPAAGGLLAYVAATFDFYWWHRWRHESDSDWNGRCGFDAAQEERLVGMLRFRDVHRPRRPR